MNARDPSTLPAAPPDAGGHQGDLTRPDQVGAAEHHSGVTHGPDLNRIDADPADVPRSQRSAGMWFALGALVLVVLAALLMFMVPVGTMG